jgi:outer membrane beta-barrel protein
MLGLVAGFLTIGSSAASRADILKDFDSLGGNDVLLERARAINPDVEIRVVQDRIVDRRGRVELAPDSSFVLGGDAYARTQNLGASATYHFTPQWSLELRYNYSFNQLRPEGEFLIQDRAALGKAQIPDIDYQKQQGLLVLNWYPVFGKMNLYDLGVAHFDVYALVGAGAVQLRSGVRPTATAGGGVGFWISQHLTTRFELRWQGYQATRYDGDVFMNTTVAGVQFGYML